MRRKDREVTNWQDMIDIVHTSDVCRLGLSDEGKPYIVPMNFGFIVENDKCTLYFHCAHEGRKLDILRKNPAVCFEMDCQHQLISHKDASKYSMSYASIIGDGLISFITDEAEKRTAMLSMMAKYAPDETPTFDKAILDTVTILRLDIQSWSGKCNPRPPSQT